jgi:hypothetical protein
MFNLNLLRTTGGRFFEEADAGSGGGGDQTGEPMKSTGDTHVEPTRLRTKPTNVKDFLGKSKLVKTEGQTADGTNVVVPGGQAQPAASPKSGEGEKNEPEDVLVAGPGHTPQQPKSGQVQGTTNEPLGEGTPSDKVKIGETEYSVEQVQAGIQALQTREKDDENRKTWQGNLTKKSQIVAAMTDQQVQEILPYATGQRKLPENIKDELRKMEDVSKTFTVTDKDGYETEVSLDDIPQEALDGLANSLLMKKWPEFADIVAERDRLKADNEKISSSVSQEQYGRGVEMSVNLMKEHPDVAITLHKGDDLKHVLGEIMRSGEAHPEYENAVRFGILLKAVNDGFMPDLDTAYTIMVSGNKPKADAAAQVLKNQGQNPPEIPNGQRQPLDDGRAFLERKRNVKSQKIVKLGR